MILAHTNPVQISDVNQLRTDDEIQTRHRGAVLHQGRVLEIMATLGVFWILDSSLGTRKLIDMTEHNVWSMPARNSTGT